MPQIFANNAISTLSAGLLAAGTTAFIQPAHGGRFPVVAGGDFCFCTLEDASGNLEIVKVTAHGAAANSFTITRAQQGTTALDWTAGDLFELRPTAGEATTWEATSAEVLAARQAQASLLANLLRFVTTFAPMPANVDAGGKRITNAADAVGAQDYVTLAQLLAASFDGLLPGQAGNAGRLLGTDGSTPSWVDLFPMMEVTGTAVTAEPGGHYVLVNAAASSVLLPAAPEPGAIVIVTVANGRYDNVIYRGGEKIRTVADDLLLDRGNGTWALRYINATTGWEFF